MQAQKNGRQNAGRQKQIIGGKNSQSVFFFSEQKKVQ
jgi:hypothetical protein